MKIETAKAAGRQLDWGLSKALGHEKTYVSVGGVDINGYDTKKGWMLVKHTDPLLCFELIKQHRAWIEQYDDYIEVTIYYPTDDSADPDLSSMTGSGATLEEALADCLIALKLGDEFEIPCELSE